MTLDHVIPVVPLIALVAISIFLIARARSLRQRHRDAMDAVEGGRNTPVDRSRS